MTLRHEVSVLRKKCASLPGTVQRDKPTTLQSYNEELERAERGRRDAFQRLEDMQQSVLSAEKGKQEALFEVILHFSRTCIDISICPSLIFEF
jgi:hypothetical protein